MYMQKPECQCNKDITFQDNVVHVTPECHCNRISHVRMRS